MCFHSYNDKKGLLILCMLKLSRSGYRWPHARPPHRPLATQAARSQHVRGAYLCDAGSYGAAGHAQGASLGIAGSQLARRHWPLARLAHRPPVSATPITHTTHSHASGHAPPATRAASLGRQSRWSVPPATRATRMPVALRRRRQHTEKGYPRQDYK